MSKRINVILLEDVSSIGKAGDVVAVSEGYARNFLFTQGKAARATDQVIKKKQTEKAAAAAVHSEHLARLQEQAAALDGTELTISARVKDGEEIFGSITAAVIAKQLAEQAKIALKPKDILLKKPLTTLGGQDVVIRLSPEFETTIRVTITPEAGSEPKAKEE